MAMDSLPPEIWEQVAQSACSDNGFTGRSLSLVSRQMHDIVKPYKLRSIAVVGGAQIIKFSEFLTSISTTSTTTSHLTGKTPPQTTIQNLFVGITNPRLFPPLTTSSDLLLRSALNSLSLSNDSTSSSNTGQRSRNVDALDITIKAVHRILKLVAPTLHTLHFHSVPIGTLSSTSFPFPMPRLSELTVYGPLLNSHTGNIPPTTSLLTVFPSLERLRMGNYQALRDLPTDFLPRLASSLPRLTHISLFQPLPSVLHVHSLGRLIMSPGTFWSGLKLEKLIIEVDINSVLYEENTTSTADGADDADDERGKLMPWLDKLRNCVRQTADTRVCLIETCRSWVDVETAQIEWSQRNMGMPSFRTGDSVLRSSGSFSEE